MDTLFSNAWDSFNDRDVPANAAKTPSFSQLFQNFGISSNLQKHLYNIYSTLTLLVLTAAAGAIATYNSPQNQWLWIIIQLAATLTFYFSSPLTQIATLNLQSVLLYVIAASTGVLLTPLLHMANQHDTTVIPIALGATVVVFAALTIGAFRADRLSVLYYWSGISMLIGMLSFYGLIISLFGLNLMPQLLWTSIGLVFLLFTIVLDTQNIVYRFEQAGGNSQLPDNVQFDYKADALVMFWNFMKLFVRIVHLVIKFTNNKKKEERERERRR